MQSCYELIWFFWHKLQLMRHSLNFASESGLPKEIMIPFIKFILTIAITTMQHIPLTFIINHLFKSDVLQVLYLVTKLVTTCPIFLPPHLVSIFLSPLYEFSLQFCSSWIANMLHWNVWQLHHNNVCQMSKYKFTLLIFQTWFSNNCFAK